MSIWLLLMLHKSEVSVGYAEEGLMGGRGLW